MMIFTEEERLYVNGQRLARLATADASGAPHVVPVGFQLSDGGTALEVGGHDVTNGRGPFGADHDEVRG
jgi:pyridoxamine 5'-phosphate oxidase family protein